MGLSSGATLGPYEIVALVGSGGTGEVYRARDTKLCRDVAIKILRSSVTSDPDHLRRLEREAQTLASLNHPNVGAIYGVEECDGLTALVLELVDGPTLAERRGPIPLDEAADIARQLCTALDAAHERGIVHRDLKPANIKITPEGVVKVLDFGLAKPTHPPSQEFTHTPTVAADTMHGVLLGTAPYMSPEQARGRPLDKRTDIWAFGCVLYEMLTGRRAFPGETLSDTIAAILERTPDWTALPAPTPTGLRRLLQRCLEKDPRQRLRDIADARVDLQDALLPASTAPRPGTRWWIGGALAAAAAAGAIVMAVVPRDRAASSSDNPLARAVFTRVTDFPGDENDAAISPDGKFIAFRSDRDGASDVWLTQVGTGRLQKLAHGKDEEVFLPVRNLGFTPDASQIWLAGSLQSQRRLRLVPLMGGTPHAFLRDHAVNVAWSPDGTRLVYHTYDPGDPMFVADRAGANSRQIFIEPRPGGHNHFQVWSPDGRWIYFVSGVWDSRETDVWRIAPSGASAERLTNRSGDIRYLAPLDNRTVLFLATEPDGTGPWIWALDVDSRATRRLSSGLERYTSLAATADGRRLVASIGNPTASLWEVPILDRVAEEHDAKPFALPTVRAVAPRFGGAALFYLSSTGLGDGLWRYQDGEALEIWKGAEGPVVAAPAVSPDGHRLAVAVAKQREVHLYLVSADGAESQPIASTVDARGVPCWAPDGNWIVTGGSDSTGPGLFKIPVGGGAAIRLVDGPAINPVWSPKDSLIVYTGPSVGNQAPILAVRPDGARVDLLVTKEVEYNGERYRFLPDGSGLVYMRSTGTPWPDFWLLDVATKKARQLTRLTEHASMRSFDITPDGKRIVFDRLRENSDIVLIDVPQR